jgi:hypothetical protein
LLGAQRKFSAQLEFTGLTYFTVLSVDTMRGRSISSLEGGASIIKRARG